MLTTWPDVSTGTGVLLIPKTSLTLRPGVLSTGFDLYLVVYLICADLPCPLPLKFSFQNLFYPLSIFLHLQRVSNDTILASKQLVTL